MIKDDYVDFVYLQELDSVRKSYKEQLLGEKALFDALIYQGKVVVLTYNQIVDSITFLHCIKNEKSFNMLLKFFENGRLRVNQYKKDMNLSKYIQDNYHSYTSFQSTYFSFLNKYDVSIRNIIYDGLKKSIKYGDVLYLRNVMPPDVIEIDQHDIYLYIKFILTINSYMYKYKCYVTPRNEDQIRAHKMSDYMDRIFDELKKIDLHYAHLIERLIFDQVNSGRMDTRSNYLKAMKDSVPYEYHLIVTQFIDLAYNLTLEYSIPIINREDHLLKDLDNIIKTQTNVVDNSVAEVKCKWEDGYRVATISAWIYRRIRFVKWSFALWLSPFVEMVRVGVIILLAIFLFLFMNFVEYAHQVLIAGTMTIGVALLYESLSSLIEDLIKRFAPEWASHSIFKAISYFFRDFSIVIKKGR